MSLPTSFSTSNATTQTNTQSNSQPQNMQPRDSRSYYFVRLLIFVLVTLFVMAILFNSIAWSILNPHPPIIRVNALSISNITQSTPNDDIELNITNPNKKINMLIDQFNITVLYGRTLLSNTYPPIDLRKMSQRNITAKLERDLGNSMHGKGCKNRSEFWCKEQVNFNVVMEIRARFTAWNFLTKRTLMKVCCSHLIVKFSSKGTGKLKVGGKDCFVHFRE